jgi:hypothetical protein
MAVDILDPDNTNLNGQRRLVEHHIGFANTAFASEIINNRQQSAVGKPSTITKRFRLRHFRAFPQVDLPPLSWHFSAPLSYIGTVVGLFFRGQVTRSRIS